MNRQQMERVSSAVMDSPAEKLSHQRTVIELRQIFSEPLRRLDAISQADWDHADEG